MIDIGSLILLWVLLSICTGPAIGLLIHWATR